MVQEGIAKAKVLVESLPYLREFSGKTVVVKYGGHAMVDEQLKKNFALDIILMQYVGIHPVVVHGGGPQINRFLEKMQVKPNYVQGMRVTDGETMDVVEMVLVGKVNKEIVGLINHHGGKAVGLSGRDGDLVQAEKMTLHSKPSSEDRPPELIDIGRVGKVTRVNPEVLSTLDSSQNLSAAQALITSKFNESTPAPKIARFLGSRGFSEEVIEAILEGRTSLWS